MTGRRLERGATRWSKVQVGVVTTDGTPFNVRGQRDLGHIGGGGVCGLGRCTA